MADVRFAYEVPRVGRLDRGLRHGDRPTRVLSRREIATAGRARRRVAGRSRARSRRTRTSTWFASDWTDGRWRPRSWSSPPSGGSGKCDEHKSDISSRVVMVAVSSLDAFAHRCRRADSGCAGAKRRQRRAAVESDPISCWWKADRTAVRVGERFGLVLTCGVIEAGPITVVPVLNQLEPGALSIDTVRGGQRRRGEDIVAPPWRYVQFEYSVRLLSDGFFGQDVRFRRSPSPTTSRAPARNAGARSDATCCPRCRCAILSLVPKSASDIRDASGQTFASIASRRFRASLANILAWVSFAFAGVLAIFALVRAVRQLPRPKSVAAVRKLPVPSVLGGCLRRDREVASDASRTGWSPDLARRARGGDAHRRRRRTRAPGGAELRWPATRSSTMDR